MYFTGLDDGNICRKVRYLKVKPMVSCKPVPLKRANEYFTHY